MADCLIRADASIAIGTGHVRRCLALAQALRKRGVETAFLCRRLSGALFDEIEAQGFVVFAIDADAGAAGDSRAATEIDQIVDAQVCLGVVAQHRPRWLLVDHYGLDADWERCMREHAGSIAVIDDLANRSHDCDLLVDITLGRRRSDYASYIADAVPCLLGPQYALLREEFAVTRAQATEQGIVSDAPWRTLLTLGGSDPDGLTPLLLQTLLASPEVATVTVLLSKQSPGFVQTVGLAAADDRVRLIDKAGNMAELMSKHDLCVGAAGGTAWERCCLGLPSLQCVLADNQLAIAAALESRGAAVTLDPDEPVADFRARLAALRSCDLQAMSVAARAVCDGRGSERVAAAMFGDHHA